MTEIWFSPGENSLQGCVVKSLGLEGHPDSDWCCQYLTTSTPQLRYCLHGLFMSDLASWNDPFHLGSHKKNSLGQLRSQSQDRGSSARLLSVTTGLGMWSPVCSDDRGQQDPCYQRLEDGFTGHGENARCLTNGQHGEDGFRGTHSTEFVWKWSYEELEVWALGAVNWKERWGRVTADSSEEKAWILLAGDCPLLLKDGSFREWWLRHLSRRPSLLCKAHPCQKSPWH